MALRNIVQVGDKVLTKKSRTVTDFNKRLWELLDDMADTLFEANGTGLAAPQVGILRRAALVLVRSDEEDDEENEIQEGLDTEIVEAPADIAEAESSKEEDEQEDEEDGDYIIELINPEIIEVSGEQTGLEGCLSLPGVWGIVTRPMRVKVRAQDRYGEYFEVEGEGLTARAFCHEIAHLNGEMFTEVADKILDTKEIEALLAEKESEKDADKAE